ncbi:MAG: matrixin family metalloprotease [candidate division Zixibacteria bacterium]|nr:matrixin family metalloprotease [candidate division Zixibacteria bacterium]
MPFNVTRAQLQLALEALPAIVPGDVVLVEVQTGQFDIEFTGELSSTNVAQLIITNLTDGTITVTTQQEGLETGLNDKQVITVNATDGTFHIEIYLPEIQKTLVTASLPYDADAEQVRRALQHELARKLNGLNADADLYRTREAFKSDFSVARIGNTYIIGFQGVTRQIDGGQGVSLMKVVGDTDFNTSGGAEIVTRMDGINYYGFEEVNIDFGSGDDILNVQGTSTGSFKGINDDLDNVHAATNITLADGDDRIFISSNADLDLHTDKTTAGQPDVFEFLTGDLDDIMGNLNIDVGEGCHRLLISDEVATVGDPDVIITDMPVTPTGEGGFDETSAAEIQIQGLAFGDITYGADPAANLFDGVIYWTGSGDDTIDIDGTHYREGERTTTVLNTGLGDDHITVDLDTGEDGFFVLNTMGGAASHTPVDSNIAESDEDTVRASESTLPLIIFGGLGNDDIIAGQNEDVVFGDFGRVQYLDGGQLIAVFGFGGRDDMISSQIIDPTWVISRDMNLGGVDIIEGQGDDDILIGGPGGNSIGDYIDGDTGDDLIFGDVVQLFRRDTDVTIVGGVPLSITNPRFQTLSSNHIYTRSDTDNVGGDESGAVLVDGIWRDVRNQDGTPVAAWNEYLILNLYHNKEIEDGNVAGLETSFGDDYIAGGANHDVIFGQLGDDIIQGDGSIESAVGLETIVYNRITNPQPGLAPVGAQRNLDGTIFLTPTLSAGRYILDYTPSFEADTDGDDYIEGNGGNDVIFGNLGQDDIVGDNSSLFTLNEYDERLPAGQDIIFGGAGTNIDRNDIGDATVDEENGVITVDPTGHARDADVIAGDNANIYRLVGSNGTDGSGFLEFNYDQSYDFGQGNAEDRGDLRIIPRAVELLDYTLGGPDFDPASAAEDIGEDDEIHGESGDDFIYGMVKNDILFGDGQDDDLIGGWGADWVSGGTGQDGVLGDDGRIFTSRNTNDGEPLYGVAGFANNEMDLYIYTPGKMQQATINVKGELKKTVDMTPFNLTEKGLSDDVYDEPDYADDIIYGGLGSDFLHGGPGDDAISGAEALPEYFEAPINPGDVLRFGDHSRAGEFYDYDEYNALAKMDAFLLNFDETEGMLRPGGTMPKATGQQTETYGEVYDDGNDKIFGDMGNDWLVGGTGRDNMYGGFGNDLLDADDNKETNLGLNDIPDTHPTYEDRAYGGAGRDVLIANTGGDRLIDWIGEFNTYLVPFAPFGMATVSRTLQPQLMDYLYALSESDGADPTRIEDGGDPARNGEPWGELGLVLQKDPNWHDQTGAPIDPQAGNIPGGKRDVLRSADFNNGENMSMFADSGIWVVESGKLMVSADSLHGDAVSVLDLDDYLPSYFEILATITMEKPNGGWKANSYVIFDYQSAMDFKFAGIDASRDKIQLGHRTVDGWIIDAETPAQIKPGIYYNVLVAVNGTNVTVVVDGSEYFSYTYEARVDADGWVYGLNSGMIGLGSDNSRGTFDNIAVQVLPPEYTLEATEDFADEALELLTVAQSGEWQLAGSRYNGFPINGDRAISLIDLGLTTGLAANSILDVKAIVNTDATSGIVFDYYSYDDFKYAGFSADGDALVIGHYKSGKWVVDASTSFGIEAGRDYELAVSLKGTTVSVSMKESGRQNWQAMVGFVFNAVVVDGSFGLLSKDGSSSFDTLTVKTDDPAFRDESGLLVTASTPQSRGQQRSTQTQLTDDELTPIVQQAIEFWTISYLLDDSGITLLNSVEFQIVDLDGLALGYTSGTTIQIDLDAAGFGWFVDATPADNNEFTLQSDGTLLADPSSPASGKMDLLTVVIHELGHVLGLDDSAINIKSSDVMTPVLTAGTRRLTVELNQTDDHELQLSDIESVLEGPLNPVMEQTGNSTEEKSES